MIKTLKEALTENDGSVSLMRVVVLGVVVVVLVKNVYLTVMTGQNVPLNLEDMGMVLGSLAVKAAQKPFEKAQ